MQVQRWKRVVGVVGCDVCKRSPLSRQDNVEMCDVVYGSTRYGVGVWVWIMGGSRGRRSERTSGLLAAGMWVVGEEALSLSNEAPRLGGVTYLMEGEKRTRSLDLSLGLRHIVLISFIPTAARYNLTSPRLASPRRLGLSETTPSPSPSPSPSINCLSRLSAAPTQPRPPPAALEVSCSRSACSATHLTPRACERPPVVLLLDFCFVLILS
jgi:hypothetical protein